MHAAPAPCPAPQPAPRIAQLDILRGLAVMGIVLANLPAFGLPEAAYFSPLAWGGHNGVDRVLWFANVVLVEGKMRGLFSMLFGASMLLVIDRARAAGDSPAQVHFTRMAVLFAIGCLHLYLIWWGDILTHYAVVGSGAYMFARMSSRWLLTFSIALLLVEMLMAAAGAITLFASAARDTPAAIGIWNAFAHVFGVPPRADLLAEIAANRTSLATATQWRWDHATSPLDAAVAFGAQTLDAMLLGMAAYRSGFLSGAWSRRAYILTAAICLAIALTAYAACATITMAHGFDQRWVFLSAILFTAPFRLVASVGYAALCMLAFHPGGQLTTRIAAVGRAAFTNYLGTSILMLLLFTVLGRYGQLSRAQLYLIAPILWGLMLAWSQPWLARYRFGPLEWIWRTLARWKAQPMRRTDAA